MDDLQISLINVASTKPHVHGGMECILVIKGSVTVSADGESHQLGGDDFIVINPGTVHTIGGNPSNILLSLSIDMGYLQKQCGSVSKYRIGCVLVGENPDETSREIKNILTKMLVVYINKAEGYELNFRLHFLKLMYLLYTHYKAGLLAEEKRGGADEAIAEIMRYISDNYNKPLSLNALAERSFMTPQYFSTYFKRKTGVGFSTYLQDIRLECAVKELTYTGDSILKIALQNGFPNEKAFSAAFKRKFSQPPGQYRAKFKAMDDKAEINQHEIIDLNSENSNIRELMKYVKKYESFERPGAVLEELEFFIDLGKTNNQNGQTDSPNSFIMLKDISDIFNSSVAENLLHLQSRLQINTIYFPLDYEDAVISDDTNTKYFDLHNALNFMESKGFVPFISIRAGKKPEDAVKSLEIIFNMLCLCFPARFTAKWMFEIIPFPCLAERSKQFYTNVYKCIRQSMKAPKIGLYSVNGGGREGLLCFQEVLRYTIQEDCKPDFLTFMAFANTKRRKMPLDKEYFNELRGYHRQVADKIHEACLIICGARLPLYMTFWNTLVGDKTPEITSYFRTAVIMDSLMGLKGIEGAGYWLDTSMYSTLEDNINVSTLALYVFNKVPRPIFHVLEALWRLKGKALRRGENMAASINEDGELVVLVWNPVYLNPIYAMDNAITKDLSAGVKIMIKGLANRRYYIKKFTYNQENSGVLGRAINAGYVGWLDKDAMEYYLCSPGKDFLLMEHSPDKSNILTLTTCIPFNGAVMFVMRLI